ncbi:MAG TPA: hypothetical protein VM555_08245 [Tahibacter sp.]|nr:hypothetical protein [Tahibacter sp.]
MPLDFSIKPTDTMPGGLTMVLMAGEYADRVTGRPMVWCSEEAFGFVEPVVGECWPRYRNYGHWGVNEIPVDDWRAIVATMRERKLALLAAKTPREAYDLVIYLQSKRATRELVRDFEVTRASAVRMIDDLVAWLEAQFESCRVITLCGV